MRISTQSAGAVCKILAAGEALASRKKGAKAQWVNLMEEMAVPMSDPKYVAEHKARVCLDIAELEGIKGMALIEARALTLMDHSFRKGHGDAGRTTVVMRRVRAGFC